MTKRADSIKFIFGGKGNDSLQGSAGKDVIVGRAGDDVIQGGAGKDVVYGDDVSGGKFWGCKFSGWWHGRGAGNDFLDGGAGSDLVFGGRGNDVLQYSMAGNLGAGFADVGAHDFYDGGKGNDVLKLQLTYGEFALASVQQDIAAFQAFLARYADAHSGHGKTFHFNSFDLDARNFESLQIEKVNNAPAALDDAAATGEDTPLSIDVLANDSDADHLDQIAEIVAAPLSTLGAEITPAADGSLVYDPSRAPALQQLAQGAIAVDHFSYAITDLGSESASATVQVTVTGVNDQPTAVDDVLRLPVSSGGGGGTVNLQITFASDSNPADVDGFEFAGFSISPVAGEDNSATAYAFTGSDNAGGLPGVDGVVRQVSGGDFSPLSLSLASYFSRASVTIEGFRGGDAVPGAVTGPIAVVNTAFTPISFDSAWSGVDELRFYSSTPADYILLDNLQVVVSSGSGTPSAGALDIDVLANDTDIDAGDALALLSFDDTSAMGALITQNPDGTLKYDPTGMDLPAPGESVTDTFEYTVSDGHGGTSVASVSVELYGADDPAAPLAALLGAPDADVI